MADKQMERFQAECAAFFETLWTGEKRPLVFGAGLCEEPLLMLIGEAPGHQEAMQGKPFVGKAGQNLSRFLQTLGLTREEIYISNVVKLHPTRLSPAGRLVNRPPTREEQRLFQPWLMREIALVRPRALVTLGNVPLHAFFEGSTLTVGQLHGAWRQAVVSPPDGPALTLPLYPLYHPAAILYNRSLDAVYQEDLLRLRDSLRLPGDGA